MRHHLEQATICIIGLGYVGLPLAHAVAGGKCFFGFFYITQAVNLTKYFALNDNLNNANENYTKTAIVAGTFKSLKINVPSISVMGLTVTLRKNGADTALTLTVDSTGVHTVTEDVAVSADDLVNYKVVTAGVDGSAKVLICLEFEPS